MDGGPTVWVDLREQLDVQDQKGMHCNVAYLQVAVFPAFCLAIEETTIDALRKQ